jgi:hypothetical protein
MLPLSKEITSVMDAAAALIRSDYRWSLQHVDCDGERLCAALRVLPASEIDFWPAVQVLYDKLYELMSGLSLIPSSAITVQDNGRVRDVVVFDTLVYRFDRQMKTITAGFLQDGRFVENGWDVGLLHPLASYWWLLPVISARGLSEVKAQKDLFITDELMQQRDKWLADTAYALLKNNPRFVKLRREIRKALSLDMDRELTRLALLVRNYPQREVSNHYYSVLWQHEDDLRHVRRICPKAAPLMAVAMIERRGDFSREPLAALRNLLSGNGHLPPALWKCVISQGAEMFRAAWSCISAGGSRITAAANYLQFLSRIEVKVSPPFQTVWVFLRHFSEFAHPGWVLDSKRYIFQIAFKEASRLSQADVTDAFIENFMLVCRWAVEEYPQLDRQQRKAGWPWVLKQAREWDKKKIYLACHADAEWVCPVPMIEYEQYVIYALGNAEVLVDEALAMRHCAEDYIEAIEDGEYRLFSVRKRKTMEAVATLSLSFNPPVGLFWLVHQIKGFANQPLEPQLYELGLHIMRLHNAPLLALERRTRRCDSEDFDENIYQAVKPHFEVLVSTFRGCEKNRTWLCRELYRYYGPGIHRYAGRFANDIKLPSR